MKPEILLFAKTHEWVSVATDGGQKVATVGLTEFAVQALTDLVFIELPKVGRQVKAGESFCEVESVKAVSDVYAPVAGDVIAVNETLPDKLETLSRDPYGDGWMVRMRLTSAADRDALLGPDEYAKHIGQ